MTKQKYPNKDYSFDKKWSPAIAAHGFTSLPNLLLRHYKELKITTPELRIIIAIELHRWDDNQPWPSINTLAKLAGISGRRARVLVSSLDGKGLVVRVKRDNDTNKYNLDPLIHKLDQLATSVLPPGRKDPPRWEETRLETRMESSYNEYAAKKTLLSKPTINNGIEKIGETIDRKYSQ